MRTPTYVNPHARHGNSAVDIIVWVLAAIISAILLGVYVVAWITLMPFVLLFRFLVFVARGD